MILQLRRLWEWTKLILLFIVFTLVGYALIGLVAGWLEPSYRFEEPAGRAIKVFSYEEPIHNMPQMRDWERLKLFYWIGE